MHESMASASASQPTWSDPNSGGLGNDALQAQEIHDTSNDTDFLTKPYSTLDEPIRETIMRDIRSVTTKLKVVLLPLQKRNPLEYMYETVSLDEASDGTITQGEDQKKVLSALRDWDLWGPLVVCLTLSIILSIRAPSSQVSSVFAAVFMSMWIGSAIVTVNAKLLGASISFFQSVCVLGYCVFPFCLSAVVILILQNTPLGRVWLDIIWVGVGFVWATRASTVFIAQFIQKERRLLAVFPVLFYYTLLGWLVLLF